MSTKEHGLTCPTCAHHQKSFICGDCVHERIEVIRNSVIDNDYSNNSMRRSINSIFDLCERMCYTETGVTPQMYAELFTPASESLRPHILLVKHLALQLHRMEVSRSRLKVNGIQRTTDSLTARVNNQKAKVDKLRKECELRRSQLSSAEGYLSERFKESDGELDSQLGQLHAEKIGRVTRQAFQLHFNHYKVLRDVAFSYLSPRQVGTRLAPTLRLFGLPVIPLSSFLSHNNKLTTINTFIENLIRLQILLVDLFSTPNDPLDLPHLPYLRHQLPDSTLYDAVQERINTFMAGSDETLSEDVPPQSPDEDVSQGDDSNIDKVIVRDNVIRVPLSSKTANFQRRASLKPGSEKSWAESVAGEDVAERPISPRTTSRESTASAPKSSIAPGRKVVIIPHKILTKPFTKLNLKEYLKFIIVVVKIIVNFQIFFEIIQSTSTSLSTCGLRSKLLLASDNYDIFDFEGMLSRIAQMDSYFINLQSVPKPDQMAKKSSSSLRSVSNSTVLSVSDGPPFDQLASSSKMSRVRALYNSIFVADRAKQRAPQYNVTLASKHIYGITSEGTSLESSTVDELPTDDSAPKKGNARTLDVKEIMETVRQTIADGNDKDANNEALKLATRTMMEESKTQLDDWDVVSRLY